MAEYLSPGVYVEEYDNSPRAVEGVGTSTADFRMAVKGRLVGHPPPLPFLHKKLSVANMEVYEALLSWKHPRSAPGNVIVCQAGLTDQPG